MSGAGDILAPPLDPFDRLAEQHREIAGQRLLAVHVELASEAAADLGRDHADVVLAELEHLGQARAQHVRNLGRRPHRQVALARVPLRDDAARLHRDRREALVDDLETHHLVGVAHRLVHRGRGNFHLERDVGAELVVQNRRAVGDRLFRIDHRVERVVVDFDQVECVLCPVGVGGDRDRHRFADISAPCRCASEGWNGMRSAGATHGSVPILSLRSSPASTQTTPGAPRAAVRVDGIYLRMRMRTAQDNRRQHPRQPDVVDVDALALNEPRILAPLDAFAHEFRDHRHRDLLFDTRAASRASSGRQPLPAAHLVGRVLHRLDDVLIAGAAAEIAFQGVANLGLRSGWDCGSADRPRPSSSPACSIRIATRVPPRSLPAPDGAGRRWASPSTVVTLAPSACTASTVHDLTALPSTSTVQAPHSEVSQPT